MSKEIAHTLHLKLTGEIKWVEGEAFYVAEETAPQQLHLFPNMPCTECDGDDDECK
jgi:hypothetical protein